MSSARNYVYGITGFLVPTLFLVVAIPVLLEELGQDGFGIYFFATSLTGTIALLDAGIGNAAVRFVAADLAENQRRQAADVISASLVFYAALGVIGAVAVWTLAPFLAATFGGDKVAITESETMFRIAALQVIPALIVGTSVAFFKALQRFDLVASTLSLVAIGTYGGAMVAASLGDMSIVDMAKIGLVTNCLALGLCGLQGYRVGDTHGISLRRSYPILAIYRRLVAFGMFMTLNSVSAFFLQHIQRYLIGAFLGPGALAAYQIAYTLPSKVHALVNSGAEMLFPRASADGKGTDLRVVYLRVLGISLLMALVMIFPLWMYAEPLLQLWVGRGLAQEVSAILTPMLIAFFVISLSPAPFHVVNGLNRPGLNTLSYAFNAVLNISFIGLFALDGLTLADFAWAFALANVVNGVVYQGAVEYLVWGNLPQRVER